MSTRLELPAVAVPAAASTPVGQGAKAIVGAWWLDPLSGLLIAFVAFAEPMAVLALVLYAAYLGLAFGLRSVLQLRRTGSSGFKGISGRPGSAEWTGGVLFVVALGLGAAAPVFALLGVVEAEHRLDGVTGHVLGFVLAVAGIVLTLLAQLTMGDAWRIGVDDRERTRLVTSGPFAVVRNPIFSAMLPTSLGLVLLVPSWVALLGLFTLVVALQLQTRAVEEPYLLRVQGDQYAAYAARVGRFVPWLGRLR